MPEKGHSDGRGEQAGRERPGAGREMGVRGSRAAHQSGNACRSAIGPAIPGMKRSTRRLVVDEQERELVEMIHELRQQGMDIEQIVLWLMRQNEYLCKRRLDNYKAVESAIAAKKVGFPKQTDGKRMVKEWQASRSLGATSLPAAQTRVITR
jgi:hypothetical protein